MILLGAQHIEGPLPVPLLYPLLEYNVAISHQVPIHSGISAIPNLYTIEFVGDFRLTVRSPQKALATTKAVLPRNPVGRIHSFSSVSAGLPILAVVVSWRLAPIRTVHLHQRVLWLLLPFE
jgi:hypothetical protein